MLPARRKSVLALIGCAVAAAAAVPLLALSAEVGTKAPDLRADPVENIVGPAVYTEAEMGPPGIGRLLVRFDGFVTNVGDGPLEIRGNPQPGGGVGQYAWSALESIGALPSELVSRPTLQVVFERTDGHNHFHLKRAMEYSLWNLTRTAPVAPGQKVGFCLYDLDSTPPPPSPAPGPEVYSQAITQFCDQNDALSENLRMGVSAGWRDVYDASLPFQWVDVSRTVPGTYLVASAADPDDAIWEGDPILPGGVAPYETNLRAFASPTVTVPGHVSQPVAAAQIDGSQAIALASTSFGSPGPRRFAIVSPPTHGTLSQAAGAAFDGPSVTYTPTAGYTGTDAFTYVARDATSDFPARGFEPSRNRWLST